MPWWWGRWRRRRWGRRRRRPWRLRRRRFRRSLRRGRRRRYVSRRGRRRTYRRRRRRGRRRGRRKRHKPTIILRQWQPDVVRPCKITGWMPLIICGSGSTQFNFITHMDDFPPMGATYGGNFTNVTFSLEAIYEQFLYHRNRWSTSNHDLDLARYQGTTLKLYRHEYLDYIVSYNRTGPFQISDMTYLSTHPALMLLQKHRIVVPSFLTKPKGRRSIKIRIKPPKLMLSKWYFTKDICSMGLFQLQATACTLNNPWLRDTTKSPVIGFRVLKNSYYSHLSNLADEENENRRRAIIKHLHPTTLTGTPPNAKGWEPTYTKLMAPTYYRAMPNSTYNWLNYQTNYALTIKKFEEDKATKLDLINKEYHYHYPTYATKDFKTNSTLTHDYGIYSPYYLTPTRISLDWQTPWTYVRYNPLADKGLGNIVYCQWCSEKTADVSTTKSKCIMKDLPLWCIFYGYVDWVIKSTGVSSAATDMRVMIISPYTEPALIGSTPEQGFVPVSDTFCNGDMPFLAPYIPIKWWVNWYPCIAHQKEVIEAIVNCGPFVPRDQTKPSWEITLGYKMNWKWGGSPLPSQAIDDPCQKPTHELPDPDRHPRMLQVSDPTKLGPKTVFHKWDWRRGMLSKRSIKRVQEDSSDDEYVAGALPRKRNKLDTRTAGLQTPEKESYTLLQALQESGEESPQSSQEQAPQEKEGQKEALLEQLQLQKQHQRVLKRGLKLLLGDVLRLRRGVHWDPLLS
uniref:Capsid protein n=1 Tax=Alphatorquevirus homin29 TaxID=3048427 RepID=A0AAU8H642_9VIRU